MHHFDDEPLEHVNTVLTSRPKYDWFSLYRASKFPNFSDLKVFVKFTEDIVAGNGHQKEDFIAQCLYNSHACSATDFHTFRHSLYGNCFTFNSIMSQTGDEDLISMNVTHDGAENGLVVSLFLENDEYLGLMGQSTGARLVIHNFEEFPSLERKSVHINTGTETVINIHQEEVHRESDPYSNCAETWPEFSELNSIYRKYEYSLEFCEYLCVQRTLALECGCSNTFGWNFSTNPNVRNGARIDCDPWNTTDLLCLYNVNVRFETMGSLCDCPNTCYSKTFSKSTSHISWPSVAFTPHFVSLMLQSESPTVRKFISTLLSHEETSSKSTLNEKMKQNFARIQVKFETMLYTRIKESPKYTLSLLFGTMGGNLGLWIGWSILSFLELIQWIVSMSRLLIAHLINRWHTKLKSPEITGNSPYL